MFALITFAFPYEIPGEELLFQLKRKSDVPVSKQKRQSYIKNALVVLDELGYQVMDRTETHLFFQFITAWYMKGSTIITSNRSVRDWVHIFAEDQMATTAILDRLFHRSQIHQHRREKLPSEELRSHLPGKGQVTVNFIFHEFVKVCVDFPRKGIRLLTGCRFAGRRNAVVCIGRESSILSVLVL
ncbi:MAG: ATP-binding protein [Spirochaetales bacterium]|nr:ATP-binding protein [Spirochaetales bacterium]